MIEKFQKEYNAYRAEGLELPEAEASLCQVYAMQTRRLDGEEIELSETVTGNDFREEVVDDIHIYTGEETVTKKFVRFKHTLYQKTETLTSKYTVEDRQVTAYVRPDNFDGTKGRYIWVASEVATALGAILAVMLPDSGDSLFYRAKDLVGAILAMAIPVAIVAYVMFRQAKAGQKRRRGNEIKRSTEIQAEFDRGQIPVCYDEVMGVIDRDVKYVHFANDESEVKHIQIKNPKKLLRKYLGILDCSVGEAKFGEYNREGKHEYLPVNVTVYQLRSNGKTLVPEKERVELMLERRGLSWRVTEYNKIY